MAVDHEVWLRAIQDASSPVSDDPNAITAQEFADLYDCSYATAKIRLKKLMAVGKVSRVSKWIIDVGGRRLRVPAWILVTKVTKKRR
jgi:hypothetical protein